MQATARKLSVVSATSCARRRLIRDVRPENKRIQTSAMNIRCLTLAITLTLLTSLSVAQDSALTTAAKAVDWKRLASDLTGSPEFQSGVRTLFPSLTPDAQRKATDCIARMKAKASFDVTQTPIDSVIAKHLSIKLLEVVQDTPAKVQLTAISQSGDLRSLLMALQGSATPASAPTGATAEQPSAVLSSIGDAVKPATKYSVKTEAGANLLLEFSQPVNGKGTITGERWFPGQPHDKVNGTFKVLPADPSHITSARIEAFNQSGKKTIFGNLAIETPRGEQARDMKKAGLPIVPQFGMINEDTGKKYFNKWTIQIAK